MKKNFPLLFLCLMTPLFSENPFLGLWNVEIIGSPEEFIWEFHDGYIISRESGGDEENIAYRLMEDEKSIFIDSEGEELAMKYRFGGDFIDLFVIRIEESPLYPYFKELPESLYGVNELTDEAAEKLYYMFIDFFEEIAIIRLKKQPGQERDIHGENQ